LENDFATGDARADGFNASVWAYRPFLLPSHAAVGVKEVSASIEI
jgi:hypothetical protein